MDFGTTNNLNVSQNENLKDKPSRSGPKNLLCPAFFVLIAAIELVFINSSLSIVLGPVIALLLCYFYFIKKETILVTTFIVLANDALGTILLGSLSYVYLLTALVIYEIFTTRNVSVRLFALGLCACALIFQPVATESMGFRMALFTAIYTLSILIQYQKYSKEEFFEKFSSAASVIISLIALHAILTGGVEFTDIEDDYMRRGVLGVGIGDPNFSALLLSAGAAFSLNNPKFPRYLKFILLVIMFAAITVTISMTGLISFSMVCLLSLLLNKKISKGVFYVLLGIIVVILLFNIYLSLPDSMRVATIDSYIVRVEEKLVFLEQGDYASVTTNRSSITERFLNYINELPIHRQLFGGNSLLLNGGVAHNTYIGYIMQFGYLGLVFIAGYILIRFLKCLFSAESYERKGILVTKILYMVVAATLSIYSESTFAMLFTVLFLF